MQAAGNLPPLHTPEDGKDVDAKQQIAIEPNDTSALDQERSRVLSLVNDVIADYQVKTAVIGKGSRLVASASRNSLLFWRSTANRSTILSPVSMANCGKGSIPTALITGANAADPIPIDPMPSSATVAPASNPCLLPNRTRLAVSAISERTSATSLTVRRQIANCSPGFPPARRLHESPCYQFVAASEVDGR